MQGRAFALGFALFAVAFLSAGCKASYIEALQAHADAMCACTDEACAKQALADYESFTAANPVVQADEKSEKLMGEAIARFTRCRIEKLPVAKPQPPGAKVYEGRKKPALAN